MAIKRNNLIISNMVWVPTHLVKKTKTLESYTNRFYEERSCRKCEYRSERPGPECEGCPANLGVVRTYQMATKGEQRYVGLPIGDKRNICKKTGLDPKYLTDKSNVLDRRPLAKLKHPIRFTGRLYKYQKRPVADWLKAAYGILEAPPRTGKTTMATWLICKLKMRSIVLTNQTDLLRQFKGEFDERSDHLEVAESRGLKRPLVGIVESPEDLLRFDVALCTYQKFISINGRALLKSIRSRFSVLIVDEMHKCSAIEFSKVINAFNTKHKFGITATVERKDGRHIVGMSLIGPVVARSKRQSLKPIVHLVDTEIVPKTKYTMWTYGVNWIAKDEKRNKMIVNHAVRLIKEGRYVLITVERVHHAKALSDAINYAVGKVVCAEFTGATKMREQVLQKAKDGKFKCVIGMRKIVQAGINVPLWDTLFMISPMSNEPNQYQEIKRICTPLKGKPVPVIYHYISHWGAEIGCLRTCMKVYRKYCIVPPETKAIAKRLMAGRGGGEVDPDDVPNDDPYAGKFKKIKRLGRS